MLLRFLLFIILIVNIISTDAFAIREPRSTSVDSRIKVMTYSPDDVHRYTGYYGYQANVEFAEGESVDSISMGDTTAWQIVPAGRRIFLKPMEENATTNMTIITNKRMYYFELHAEEAEDINDPKMVFTVRFLYPDENQSDIRHFSSNVEPDLINDSDKLNFKYTISGPDIISPVKIFDDGDFTYFQLKDKNSPVPAFFMVDSEGHEEIVNYRVSGKYIVIERVVSRFTLRYGKDVLCVFNENMQLNSSDQ